MPTNFPTSVDNFTNPTANDSLNLPSHSTQHANANDAIEAVESYLLTGAGNAGLVKIIPTGATNGTLAANGDVTIGSAVSSVTVSGAFSAAYDNYKILVSGGVGSSTDNAIYLRLGASAASYSFGSGYAIFSGGAPQQYSSSSSAAQFTDIASIGTNYQSIDINVNSPFLARFTTVSSNFAYSNGAVFYSGMHKLATSYSDFTLLTGTGTITGGIIHVYGYK
jgi:hypothetical protein